MDRGKGLISNDINVYGVVLLTPPTNGAVTLNSDGTFTYVPAGAAARFIHLLRQHLRGNGRDFMPEQSDWLPSAWRPATQAHASAVRRAVTACTLTPATLHHIFQLGAPGVLLNDKDPAGHPLTAVLVAGSASGGTVTLNPDGSFTAAPATAPTGAGTATVSFKYTAVNSQNVSSASAATVTVTFNGGSGL